MTSKLSIIIPCYNAEAYIKRCLDKVLTIDLNKEVIVVNDGSTDNSLNLLKTYENKIKLVNLEKNGGLSNARNSGIKAATSKYLTFIDMDDDFNIDGYIEAVKMIDKKKADLLIFNLDFVEENHIKIKTRNFGFNSNSSKEEIVRGLLLDKIYPAAYIMLISRDLAKKVKFDERLSPGEDINYLTKCLIYSKLPIYFDKVIYHYIQHKNSILHNLSEKFISGHLNVINFLSDNEIKYLERNFKEEFDYFKLQMIYRAVHAVSFACTKSNKKEVVTYIKKCNIDRSFRKIYKNKFSNMYLKIEFFVLNLFGPRFHLFLFPMYNTLRKAARKSHE